MIRILIGFILGVMFTISGIAVADQLPIRLFVDGKEIAFSEAPPQIINGRTMVPARPLAEALGAKVEWDGITQSILVNTAEVINVNQSSLLTGRELMDKYGFTEGSIAQKQNKQGQWLMRIEKNGHYVEMSEFGGPEVSAVSDNGTVVNGTFTGSILRISEDDLRAANIIP